MSTFDTYRVRFCESQALAINVSARSAEEACALAQQIREQIGQEPFEEIDGATENFEAQLLATAEHACVSSFPARRRKGQGGAS